jgi:hypothetical protein
LEGGGEGWRVGGRWRRMESWREVEKDGERERDTNTQRDRNAMLQGRESRPLPSPHIFPLVDTNPIRFHNNQSEI